MELLRALGALIEPPSPVLESVAEALEIGPLPPADVHTDLVDFQLQPYASIYLSADGMLGGEARDRIAGFWRAMDAEPPAEPDHLSILLGGLASLSDTSDSDAAAKAEHARAAFVHEHLGSWLPAWLASLDRLCTADERRAFYGRWGRLLGRTVAELGGDASSDDAARASLGLPLHLREVPALADPRQADATTFLDGLLASAVSGVILVRDDLARCARELELGMRLGERRRLLRDLIGQDAPATFGWLADEAARQAEALTGDGPSVAHWRQRAEAASVLLRDLAAAARSRSSS